MDRVALLLDQASDANMTFLNSSFAEFFEPSSKKAPVLEYADILKNVWKLDECKWQNVETRWIVFPLRITDQWLLVILDKTMQVIYMYDCKYTEN